LIRIQVCQMNSTQWSSHDRLWPVAALIRPDRNGPLTGEQRPRIRAQERWPVWPSLTPSGHTRQPRLWRQSRTLASAVTAAALSIAFTRFLLPRSITKPACLVVERTPDR
jgi:hypothetical protein